jgi:hypothetical protein
MPIVALVAVSGMIAALFIGSVELVSHCDAGGSLVVSSSSLPPGYVYRHVMHTCPCWGCVGHRAAEASREYDRDRWGYVE